MKEIFNIEQPHLKENPYSVPEGYFSSLQGAISDRISLKGSESGVWRLKKPQLALVYTFAFVLLIGFGAIKLFSPFAVERGSVTLVSSSQLLEDHHLETSFIDFFDDETDSLTKKTEIDPEQIIEYLNNDASIVYLASLK